MRISAKVCKRHICMANRAVVPGAIRLFLQSLRKSAKLGPKSVMTMNWKCPIFLACNIYLPSFVDDRYFLNRLIFIGQVVGFSATWATITHIPALHAKSRISTEDRIIRHCRGGGVFRNDKMVKKLNSSFLKLNNNLVTNIIDDEKSTEDRNQESKMSSQNEDIVSICSCASHSSIYGSNPRLAENGSTFCVDDNGIHKRFYAPPSICSNGDAFRINNGNGLPSFMETSNGLFGNVRQSQLALWTFSFVTMLGVFCRKKLRPDGIFMIFCTFWVTMVISWCLLAIVVVGHFLDSIYGTPLRYLSKKLFGFAGNFTHRDNFPPQEFFGPSVVPQHISPSRRSSPQSSGLASPKSVILSSDENFPMGIVNNSRASSPTAKSRLVSGNGYFRSSSPAPSLASCPERFANAENDDPAAADGQP
uniref:Uncharacterized protein n=1 Tax=Romanomermis culicivorax TaxID=13658 RepID=A0A915J6C1_ROMCU